MVPWIQGHSLSPGVGSPSNRATGKHQVSKYGGSDSNCSQGLRLLLMAPSSRQRSQPATNSPGCSCLQDPDSVLTLL